MICSHYASLVAATFWTGFVPVLAGQTPDLVPDASRYDWVIAGPQQVVGWFTFDPFGVADRLPESVRFTTVGELANAGIPWAVDYLVHHPSHEGWGVSFLEIVRADTFAIRPESKLAERRCSRGVVRARSPQRRNRSTRSRLAIANARVLDARCCVRHLHAGSRLLRHLR